VCSRETEAEALEYAVDSVSKDVRLVPVYDPVYEESIADVDSDSVSDSLCGPPDFFCIVFTTCLAAKSEPDL